jgi:nucleotide-binding universal stress UspA family protein
MIERILVPIDFSDPSLQAADYAAELAKRRKAEIVLLHVVEPVYYPVVGEMYGVGLDLGNVYDDLQHSARVQLDRLAAKLRKRRVRVRAQLSLGTAHRVIVESAKKLKADLLVMSTHGRTGLSHVLIGWVALGVVRTAAGRVLTVPGRAPAKARRARGTRRARPRGSRAAARSKAR